MKCEYVGGNSNGNLSELGRSAKSYSLSPGMLHFDNQLLLGQDPQNTGSFPCE